MADTDRTERVTPDLATRAPLHAREPRSLPDVAAMRRWLVEHALAADGSVYSWLNAGHPGYPYPEAGGLFLSALATERPAVGGADMVDAVAQWLCRGLDRDGGVGRSGITYLFDSAVVLTGLLRYRAGGGRVRCDESIHRLRRFVCRHVGAGVAVLPKQAADDGRWSTQFGSHLVKCLQGLQLYAAAFGDPPPAELVAALIERSGRQPSPVYVHPFCYEQEGHLLAAHYGLGQLFEPIDGALELLAALQQPDGAILAFANGMEGFGEARSDATAQAVRLWLIGDPSRYRNEIARALAFLARCQTADGGIRYAPGRDDVCSWSTMFAMQAVEWFVHEPQLDELL